MAYGDSDQIKRPLPPPNISSGVGAPSRLTRADIASAATAGTAADPTLAPARAAAAATAPAKTPDVAYPRPFAAAGIKAAGPIAPAVFNPANVGPVMDQPPTPAGLTPPAPRPDAPQSLGNRATNAAASLFDAVASYKPDPIQIPRPTAAGSGGSVPAPAPRSPADVAAANTSPLVTLNIPGQPSAAPVTPAVAPTAPVDGTARYGNGRPIGFGQQIQGPNGPIQAFSDANMTPEQRANPNATDNFAKDLGGTGVVPGAGASAAPAAPTGAPSAAVTSLLERTPTLSADNAIPRPVAAGGNGWNDPVYQAQHAADSDVAAILNEDPRSVLGNAARNARMNLGDIKSPRSRSGGGAQSPYQQAIADLVQRANNPVTNAQQTAQTAAVQGADTDRARIQAQTAATEAAIRRPEPKPIQLADGTTGLLGPDGVVRPAVDAKGQPIRELQPKSDSTQKREDEVTDSLNKAAGELLKQVVPLGKTATPADVAQSRVLAAQQHGLPTATGKNGERMVKINDKWVPL